MPHKKPIKGVQRSASIDSANTQAATRGITSYCPGLPVFPNMFGGGSAPSTPFCGSCADGHACESGSDKILGMTPLLFIVVVAGAVMLLNR